MDDKTIRGLLIEDDPDDTMLLMELMARSDWPSFRFAFECVETLRDGLKFLSGGDAEVVLLDLMLPDSRGIETVKQVRAQMPDIPIVVLTGLSDETLGLDAIRHGAQDYQVKGSINEHALKRTISFAVERHRWLTGFKNILKSAPDGMAIVDAEGIMRYVNPAAELLLSRKAGDLLGKPFPNPRSGGRSGELKLPGASAAERTAEIRVSEIEWLGAAASLISMRDTTELRRVEALKAEIQERRKMDKLKDELMSAVSHEMRSPLTIIKAASSNLKEGLAGSLSQDQSFMVSMQYKNILRLEKIVDRTLDLSRLESGRALIKPKRVDAAELIRETVAGFRLLAGEGKIAIQLELPRDLPPVFADPELFIQVLSNLIENALRFAQSRVLIRVGVVENCIQTSVIDNGPGIPRERIGDLFNKFVQVGRKTGGGYKGTGLGLAICKEAIERQNGRIWAESVAGRGAQFHFALPQCGSKPAGGQGGFHAARK